MKESWDQHWRDWPIERFGYDDDVIADLLFRTQTEREWWRDKSVLDAGCGMGRYSRALGLMGAKVLACDAGAQSCKTATMISYGDVEVVWLDLVELPFKEVFDAVICLNVLAHVPERKEQVVLEKLIEALKPGGVLFLWMYRRECWWRDVLFRCVRAVTKWLPFEVTKLIGHVVVSVTRLFARKPYGRVPFAQNMGEWTAWFACRERREYDEIELKERLMKMDVRNVEYYGWLNKNGGGGIGIKGEKRHV